MVELSLNPRRLPADQTSGPVVDAQLTHSADTWPGGGGSCLGRRSARASCAARLGYQASRCNNDSCSVLRRPAAACGRAGLAEKRTVCGPPSTSHSSAMRCQLRQRCSRQRASTRCTVPSTRVASSQRPSRDCVSLCLRQWFDAIGEAGVDGGFQRYDAVCKIIPRKITSCTPTEQIARAGRVRAASGAPRRAELRAPARARARGARGPGPTPLRPRETFTMRDVCTPSFR